MRDRRRWGRIARAAALLLLFLEFRSLAQEATPGPAEPVVADVEIVGNSTIAAERILSQIKTNAGRPYKHSILKEDVRRLFATHWFYDVEAKERSTPQGVVVTLHVVERPIIQEIQFVGNKALDEKKLRDLTGLKVGKAMDPGLNRQMALRIERRYREKGYPFATCELLEGGERGDARVVMNITEGPKTRITWVSWEGNSFVSGERLETMISSKPFLKVFRPKYDPTKLEEDIAKLIEYYRSHGYLDVRVSRKLAWNEAKNGVKVTMVIDEGVRYKVNEIRFAGNKIYDDQDLSKDLKLASGSVLRSGEMQHDLQMVRDAYGKNGYIYTNVQADVRYLDRPGEVDLVYQVREDTPRRVGEVRIEGNEVTKDRVIRQYTELAPSDIFDNTKLRLSQQRLVETRLFQVEPAQGIMPTVQIDPANDPSSEFQDILVRVQEAQTGSLMFGVGVNSDAGVGGSLVINERNFDIARLPTSWSDLWSGRAFRGAGQELRIEAVPGNLVQRYAVTFREPRLFGLDYSLTTSGYLFSRIYQAYREERAGGRFTLGKRFTPTIGGSLTYRIENVNINNPAQPTPQDIEDVLGNNFINSFRVGVDHDTRDSALAPSKGHYVELSFEQAIGEFYFPKAGVEARQFFTTYQRGDGSGKHVLSLRGEVGFAGSQTPVFERYYAGGFTTLRGFQFRGVGPTDNGIEVGGDFLMLTSAEYYIPVTADDNFGFVVFCDAGTVESNIELLDYRVAAGFGLRVRVPMMGPVPLAFDFGFPINKTDQDDTQLFSFFVGLFR